MLKFSNTAYVTWKSRSTLSFYGLPWQRPYTFKLKTSGASTLHTPRSLYDNKVMKSGDGIPYNKQMITVE